MLVIDGSQGEGGGQMLRTSLSLSMVTGEPFRIDNIRARRPRSGLLRQHLTCVTAAAEICRATVTGATLGSRSVTFRPGSPRAGDYEFAIATAGATSLVLQCIWPALIVAEARSRVTLSGGTHVPFAPTFDHLERTLRPLLARMGARLTLELDRHGFHPAGGGSVTAVIEPSQLAPIAIEERGAWLDGRVTADVANLGYPIAERQIAAAVAALDWPVERGVARTVKADGPGNVVAVEISHRNVTELLTSFGGQGRTAEDVGREAAAAARAYLDGGAPIGPHLADQLLLPMALAGGGSFVTCAPSGHTSTNIAVIEKFLPVEIAVTDMPGGLNRVTVSR